MLFHGFYNEAISVRRDNQYPGSFLNFHPSCCSCKLIGALALYFDTYLANAGTRLVKQT